MEIFDDAERMTPRIATRRALSSTRKNANYGGSGVDIFDDDDDEASRRAAPPPRRRAFRPRRWPRRSRADELEDIIRVRGYDPRAIDEYFLSAVDAAVAARGERHRGATTIWWTRPEGGLRRPGAHARAPGPDVSSSARRWRPGDLGRAQSSRRRSSRCRTTWRRRTSISRARSSLRSALACSVVLDDGRRSPREPVAGVQGHGRRARGRRQGAAARHRGARRRRRGAAARGGEGAWRRPPGAVQGAGGRGGGRAASRIFEEMDFANEAKNIGRVRRAVRDRGHEPKRARPAPETVRFRVPLGLIPSLPATRRAFGVEWLEGDSVISLVSPKAGEPPRSRRRRRAR